MFLNLCLPSTGIHHRYHKSRGLEWGTLVHKRLEDIHKDLTLRNRKPWMRLIKTICDVFLYDPASVTAQDEGGGDME